MTQHVKLVALKPEDKLDFQNEQDERRESTSVIYSYELSPTKYINIKIQRTADKLFDQ